MVVTGFPIEATIKGINTQSVARGEGGVRHTTTIYLEALNLDRHILDELALAELAGRLLIVGLRPVGAELGQWKEREEP